MTRINQARKLAHVVPPRVNLRPQETEHGGRSVVMRGASILFFAAVFRGREFSEDIPRGHVDATVSCSRLIN